MISSALHRSMIVPLAFAEFAIAFATLAFEVIAARLIAPYAGMSTDTWTAIIAAFLLALALGNLAGGRIASRGDVAHSLRAASAACVLAAAAMLGVLCALPGWDVAVLAPAPLALARVIVFASLPFIPAGFCLGVATPPLVAAAMASAKEKGRAAGIMLAAGAAGSVTGVIAALWFLLDDLGVRASVVALAAVLVADAVLMLTLARVMRKAAP